MVCDDVMCSRSTELNIAMKRVQQLYETGTGGVLLIQAEAGMGKTRFVQEVIVHITELCDILERQQKEAALALANANATPAGEHTDRSRTPTPPLTGSGRKSGMGKERERETDDLQTEPDTPAKTPTLAPADKKHKHASGAAALHSSHAAGSGGGSGGEKEANDKAAEEMDEAEEEQDIRRPLRYMFGSGYSMTTKVPYSIWRNIVLTLITENAIANLQHRNESREGSMHGGEGGGGGGRGADRDRMGIFQKYGSAANLNNAAVAAAHASKRNTGGSSAATTTIVDHKTITKDRDLKPANARTSGRKSVSGAAGFKVRLIFLL